MSDDTQQQLINQPIVVPVTQFPTYRQVLERAAVKAVEYAHAGVTEEGANNRGAQVEHFQQIVGIPPGSSWCAAFVAMCQMKAFAELMGKPTDMQSLLSYVGHFGRLYMPVSGYCPTLWAEAKARGWFYKPGKHKPRAACLALWDFNQQQEPHHVSIYLMTDPEEVPGLAQRGWIKDVSGNTGPGPGAVHQEQDGDGVFVRHRPPKRLFGWIDPD